MKFLISNHTRINFKQPIKGGKLTNIVKIALMVYRYQSISRLEVLSEIFEGAQRVRALTSRSYYCGMFATLAENEIIKYNPSTRKYEPGLRMNSYISYLREMNVLPEML